MSVSEDYLPVAVAEEQVADLEQRANELRARMAGLAGERQPEPAPAPRRSRASKVQKLRQQAAEAAEIRAYQTDPDVVALRIERVRTWLDRLMWTGIGLGLAFTASNVAAFAAGDAEQWSLQWCIAWLLDPMVSLILIAVLIGEQVINRAQLKADKWVRIVKWVALGSTYCMNTWTAWEQGDPALIVQHSIPPLVVVCAAEAVTTLRAKITEAVNVAYQAAVTTAEEIRKASEPTVVVVAEERVPAAPVRRPRALAAAPEPVDPAEMVIAEMVRGLRDAAATGAQYRPNWTELEQRVDRRKRTLESWWATAKQQFESESALAAGGAQ